MRLVAILAAWAGTWLLCTSALAQPDEGASFDVEAGSDGPRSSGEPAERHESDHDGHVGNLALGFMGARFVPSATGTGAPTVVLTDEGDAIVTIAADEVTVPVFGVRYWFSRAVGVDVGFGFNVAGGSVSREIPNPNPALAQSVEFASPSTTAVAGHLALPISVYSIGHLNVLVLPEFDLGYSSSTVENFELSTTGEWLDLRLGGLLVGGGARLGAELSWGFIDLPQVSLQVSWGLRVEHRRSTGRIGDAEMAITSTGIGTSWYDDPWSLIAGNIGVFYTF